PKRLRATFRLARLARDTGVASLLLKTKFAREISPQFEFALALLDSSSGFGTIGYRTGRGSERVNHAGRMPANRRQDGTPAGLPRRGPRDLGAPETSVDDGTKVNLFKACVTEGLFQRVCA